MGGRHGTPEERFWRKVLEDPDTGCWNWQGSIRPDGYPFLAVGQGQTYAHRFSYRLLVAEPPEGLDLDHLCRNRACVNPDHLEPVTRRENVMRSPISPAAINARKTHCLRGHPLYGPNLRARSCGRRSCRECERIRASRFVAA